MKHEKHKADKTSGVEIIAAVNAIVPLFVDRRPEDIGAILASLTAIWVTGHAPKIRAEVLVDFIKLITEIVPIEDKRIFGDAGHPDLKFNN